MGAIDLVTNPNKDLGLSGTPHQASATFTTDDYTTAEDCLGYTGVLAVISSVAITDGQPWVWSLYECDTSDGTFTAVSDVTGVASFTNAEDNKDKFIYGNITMRYVKLKHDQTSASSGAVFSARLIKFGAAHKPVNATGTV